MTIAPARLITAREAPPASEDRPLTAEEYAEHGIPMPCSHGGKEQP